MRKGFEHGLHGLHGYFIGGRGVRLLTPWCVGVLNTDFTDYTDAFYWGTLRMDLWPHSEEAQNYP